MIKRLTVRDRNNVQVHGKAGKVLLYGHGFGCDQTMWQQVTPAFAGTHQQVLFDFVGSGRAQRKAFSAARYGDLQGYVQDLLDVCDELGLRSGVTFVGHSVSCSIGLLASIARPELFERLVLLGPTPCFLNHPPDYFGGFESADLEGLLLLLEQNYIGWADHLAPIIAGEVGAVSARLGQSFCSTDPAVARAFARATFFADQRADLPLVRPPCLILQHRHDALVPLAVGDYCHAQLQGSQLQILDVSGHCAHMSHPQLVIDAMNVYFAARD